MKREEVIALANSVGFVLADNACDEAVDRFRTLIQAAQKIGERRRLRSSPKFGGSARSLSRRALS